MAASVQPVFIFSLPRSGSTLLQRMLAAHPEVSTASEPWLLLPHMYATRTAGIYTEYGQRMAAGGIEDFVASLPEGNEDYQAALRDFALCLYRKAASDGTRFFIDKTPRYSIIADDIIDVFGDQGKYIFLWRNPISVISSMLTTWHRNQWNIDLYHVDLFKGIDSLVTARRRNAHEILTIQYESLIANPYDEMHRVSEFLGTQFRLSMVDGFSSVRLKGRFGDSTGTENFSNVDQSSLAKWKQVPITPIRRKWLRDYLSWIGQQRLADMGYDLETLLSDLAAIPSTNSGIAQDVAHSLRGYVRGLAEPSIIKRKIRSLSQRTKLVSHS